MTEGNRRASFWTSLPGVLTGIAALIGAVVTAYVTLHNRSGPEMDTRQPDTEQCSPTFATEGTAPGTGEILLQSGSPEAQGARVYLNGRCQERMLVREAGAILLLAKVPPGSYRIEVRKNGYQDLKRDVTVAAGQRASVDFDLRH